MTTRAQLISTAVAAVVASPLACTCTPSAPGHLPLAASIPAEPVVVHDVLCLPKVDATELCAVLVDEVEKTPSNPATGVAIQTIVGSTSSTTRWFTKPETTAPRTFTLVWPKGSSVEISSERVRFYSRNVSPGTDAPSRESDEAIIGYVVKARAPRAIRGEHVGVRSIDVTTYGDLLASGAAVTDEDKQWQRAKPDVRRLERADLQDELDRVEGHVVVRLEQQSDGRRSCVSFGYFAGDMPRGVFPCARTGPPRAMVVTDGAAHWVFANRPAG